jgi:hypothetical protein
MLLLLCVSVAILAALLLGGYLTLFSMLIAGLMIAVIWSITAVAITRRDSRRGPLDGNPTGFR